MIKRNVFWIMLAVFMFSGCQSEQQRWNGAQRTNTLDSYKEYLKSYPQGQFASECKKHIAAIHMKKQAAQREEDAKRLQSNRGRLYILRQYEVGKTTERQFLADDWNASDAVCGKLGPVSWDKREGSGRYTLGFIDLRLDSKSALDLLSAGLDFLCKEAMKNENTIYHGVRINMIGDKLTFSPHVSYLNRPEFNSKEGSGALAPTSQVCVLEFEGGVLKDIQFKGVSETTEQ